MTNSRPQQPATLLVLLRPLGVLAVHLLAMLLVLFQLCSLAPPYMEFYLQHDMELPVVTQQVLELSGIAHRYWYLWLFAALLLDVAIVALLATQSWRRPWLLSVYSYLWLTGAMLLLFYISLGLALPVAASVNL